MGNKIKLVLVFPFIAREEERIKKKKIQAPPSGLVTNLPIWELGATLSPEKSGWPLAYPEVRSWSLGRWVWWKLLTYGKAQKEAPV